jgi:hypothetical protein
MKLALSLILALALGVTGACLSVDAGDKIVAHCGGAQPHTLKEAIECCIDDRVITGVALALQLSPFHCRLLLRSLIDRSVKGTSSIRAHLSLYKLNAAFLI